MGKKPQRVRLICWNDIRSSELQTALEASAFAVDASAFEPSTIRKLAQNPPDAIVIDLGRLPAQGRDVGVAVRTRAGTRGIPLVFVAGTEEKVNRTRELLPDAIYTEQEELGTAVRGAIASPPHQPVVPASNLAGYSGTPLLKKLGIKTDTTVALVNAPGDFESTLGPLPEGATIIHELRAEAAVTLWFLDSKASLESDIDQMAKTAGDGRLWICWPKKASGITTDVTQNHVRTTGLAAGIVDFKICAIDSTWSGLCFTRRKG